MAKNPFSEWIDQQATPKWSHLPLTHVTRALFAEKVLASGRIDVEPCPNFQNSSLAYFFYGRPAYRANKDKVIQVEASSPCCFLLNPRILRRANRIYAFDTGAFFARLYNHILDDGFNASDFEIGNDPERILRLVQASFNSHQDYFDANKSVLTNPDTGANAWQLQARSYLTLLGSPGRNEPDDRICTIEVVFSDPVLLEPDLKAIIVPHTFWTADRKSPVLEQYHSRGIEIATYKFIPGRHPEYYQAHLESEIEILYRRWGVL